MGALASQMATSARAHGAAMPMQHGVLQGKIIGNVPQLRGNARIEVSTSAYMCVDVRRHKHTYTYRCGYTYIAVAG